MTRLTQSEYDILNKIARNTRMDCWFSIIQDKKNARDYVYDLEHSKQISLSKGIEQLYEGIDKLSDCKLSDNEVEIFESLLKALCINIDPEK